MNVKEMVKASNTVVVLATGSSINEIDSETWSKILAHDTLAINNFIYHPFIIPKWLSLEVRSVDSDIMKKRFDEKWDLGWKDVGYILSEGQLEHTKSVIGHSDEAIIYTYRPTGRGVKPKESVKESVDVNAKFERRDGTLYKSYKSSLTTMIHLLYMMRYTNIILYGVDLYNSKYFWSDGGSKYGETHCLTHKDRDPDEPHSISYIKNYIIDFNKRNMKRGRLIYTGHAKTSLYPEIPLWRW